MVRLLAGPILIAALAPAAAAQSSVPTLFVGHYHTTTAGVSSFAIDPADGKLQFIQRKPTGQWTSAIALSPDGRHLAAAHSSTSVGVRDIQIFRVEHDGTLTAAGIGQAPQSVMTMVWITNSILAVARTNDIESRVLTFHYNDQSQALTPISNRVSGRFTQSIVYVEPFLYSNSVLGSPKIMKWSLGPTGVLQFEEELATGMFTLNMAANHLQSQGTRLYGAGGISENSIAGLSVGANMMWLPGSPYPSAGQSPSQVVLTRDDRFLFAAHGTDDTVRAFAVEPLDGSLSQLPHIFSLAPTTGSVGNMATFSSKAGQTLYITDKWITAAAIHVFRIEHDGSMSPIQAVPESGGGRRPEGGIAVWIPPETFCYANCDSSTSPPVLNVEDFTCFINEFATAQNLPHEQQITHYANCDGSTTAPVLNVEDFTCFINAFAAGCD